MEKLIKFIKSDSVSSRIRTEINSHKESGYLNVFIDKNNYGDYVLTDTIFEKLDRRKFKWAGEIVDQREVFLFKVHDLSTEMAYKCYFETPERLYSKFVPNTIYNLNLNVN